MSYLVFARKWRPRSFDDVVGQQHVTDTLKRAIEKDRIAHAYIFSGTRGVGKTTTARILARALNCDKGPTPEPCGVCDSCKSILNGSSFDVIEIDGASNNSVDDIRELRNNVGYGSMGGRYRVFLIDEVHMLTNSAFNALLKTLEEPPPKVIFIFATTEPQKVPNTIHSRCQLFEFRRISNAQISSQLEKICKAENIAYEKSALDIVAHRGDGSMRDSLSLLDQVYSYCTEGIYEEDVRTGLGLVSVELYDSVIDSILDKNPAGVINAVADILAKGFDLHEFLLGLQEHVRSFLLMKIGDFKESRRIEISDVVISREADRVSKFSTADLLRISEVISTAENGLKRSSYPRFFVEITLLKLVFMEDSISISSLIDSLSDIKKKNLVDTESAKKSTVTDSYSAFSGQITSPREFDNNFVACSIPKSSQSVSFDIDAVKGDPDIISNRKKFIDFVSENDVMLGLYINLAEFSRSSDDSVVLSYESKDSFQYESVCSNKKNLTSFAKKFSGNNIEFKIELKGESEELKDSVESDGGSSSEGNEEVNINYSSGTPLDIKEAMKKNPVIKDIIDIFDGEVLK